MPEEKTEEKSDRFYNVEKVRAVFKSQANAPSSRFSQRLVTRTTRAIDSVSGFLAALTGILILFGGLFAVIAGGLYGPVVFLAVVGGTLGLLALYLNRKVGKSLQFGDYSIPRQLAAQIVGPALAVAFFFILLVVPKLL